MSDELIVTRTDAGVVEILLNRPDRMNALGVAMTKQLREEIEKAESANVVVIRATGRAFCSGADLKERRAMTPDGIPVRGGAGKIGVPRGFVIGLEIACGGAKAIPTA